MFVTPTALEQTSASTIFAYKLNVFVMNNVMWIPASDATAAAAFSDLTLVDKTMNAQIPNKFARVSNV